MSVDGDLFESIHDIVRIQYLLENNADPNVHDKYGNTPLVDASSSSNVPIIKLLLNAGADPNIQNSDGYTALMESAENGLTENVKLLLDAGANRDLKNYLGFTASNEAGMLFRELQELIKNYQYIHINSRAEQDGFKMLTILAANDKYPAYKLYELIRNNADIDINAQDAKYGNTALHYAIESGDYWKVRALLSANADIYRKNNRGLSPVYYGLTSNDPAIQNRFKVYWAVPSLKKEFIVPNDIIGIIRDYYDGLLRHYL